MNIWTSACVGALGIEFAVFGMTWAIGWMRREAK